MNFSHVQESNVIPIFSPCSNYFVSMNSHCAFIKEANLDLKTLGQISIKTEKINNSIQYPTAVFSPDSKLIAMSFKDRLQVWDFNNNLVFQQNLPQNIQAILWAMTQSYQLVTLMNYQCIVFNLTENIKNVIKNNKLSTQNGCSLFKNHKNGLKLMALLQRHNYKDCIGVYSTQNWEKINFIELSSKDANKIQFISNGRIVVIDNNRFFRVFLIDHMNGLITTYEPDQYIPGVGIHQISGNGTYISLGIYNQTVHLIDSFTGKLKGILSIKNKKIDTQKTIIYQEDLSAKRFELVCERSIKITIKELIDSTSFPISLMQFSHNSQFLVTKLDTMPNYVYIWCIQTFSLFSVVIFESSMVKDFKWLQNQQTLMIVNNSSNLVLWRRQINDNLQILEVSNQNFNINKIVSSKIGRSLLYSNTKKKYVLKVEQKQQK